MLYQNSVTHYELFKVVVALMVWCLDSVGKKVLLNFDNRTFVTIASSESTK